MVSFSEGTTGTRQWHLLNSTWIPSGVINHHGSVLAVVFEPPAPPVTPRGLAPSIDLSAASCAAPREVHSQLLRMTFSSFDPWARQPSEVGGFRAREVGGGLAIGVGWGR